MRWQSAVIIKTTKTYRAVQSRIQYILTDTFKSLYQHQKAYRVGHSDRFHLASQIPKHQAVKHLQHPFNRPGVIHSLTPGLHRLSPLVSTPSHPWAIKTVPSRS